MSFRPYSAEPRARILQDRLYFLAFWKHDAPQCIVAGPWIDPEDALMARLFMENPGRYVVVSTELPFMHEPSYD